MKYITQQSRLLLLVFLLGLAGIACGSSDGPPRNAAVVTVVTNTSLTPWLEGAISAFHDSDPETASGKTVYVEVIEADAGQAVVDLSGGGAGTLWIPDNEAWVNVLANQGNSAFQGNCASVAESPLVIAMWRSVAETLGWPGRDLGWLDIGSLAADPTAWSYYSGNQFGDQMRLGHTHPGLSGTGASTLLAIVQAAESKAEAVSVSDIEQPIVQASVGAFEGAVSTFSSSTAALGEAMQARGATYLSAGIMYESDVIRYGGGQLIPLYPFEGTFVADHPACINGSADAEAQEGAEIFRDYLADVDAQTMAVSHGLRPVNGSVEMGAPLSIENGIDLNEPQIVFAPAGVDTIYAVQDLWQEARKDVNLVMLLDVSGSMAGDKMTNVRTAAVQFVDQMGDDDFITIIAFSTQPIVITNHEQVGPNRAEIISGISGLQANGDTALYDAIGDGAQIIAETTSPATSNALVVLTDGQDTYSFRYTLDQNLFNAASANNTTVFTIAYGRDADEDVLEDLAIGANGNYFLGDEASIAEIYQEMSAAFGGSVGVGR